MGGTEGMCMVVWVNIIVAAQQILVFAWIPPETSALFKDGDSLSY